MESSACYHLILRDLLMADKLIGLNPRLLMKAERKKRTPLRQKRIGLGSHLFLMAGVIGDFVWICFSPYTAISGSFFSVNNEK